MSKKSNPPTRKLFPIERLPGVYREMALAMVRKYQCGVNLPSMAILGALSSAMGYVVGFIID